MIEDLASLKTKTILFVEDDNIIKTKITEVLEMLFKNVFSAQNGKEAYILYEEESPDIIISDIKMPLMDGLELIEKIRSKDYTTPVIFLTSFTEQPLLVNAANLSIDGYIIKPIELNTLIIAIKKAMKRNKKDTGLISLSSKLFFHTGTQELFYNGSVIPLGIKELELLKLLIENRYETVTKKEISYTLWPLESTSESSIKNLILRIRKKLPENIIVSVRGLGYRLDNSSS